MKNILVNNPIVSGLMAQVGNHPLLNKVSDAAIDACEKGWVPDTALRAAIRFLLVQRLHAEQAFDEAALKSKTARMVADLSEQPIAKHTDAANEQHYEVPAQFFHLHLGPRLKYSCAWYETGNESLAQAELAMFEKYAQRAQLKDGQRILDLGCGWGSMSLWMAEKFPNAQIVGLSNSNGQREYIMARAQAKGLSNVTILTANVVEAEFPMNGVAADFDRVVSIEMFEHMKNYKSLFKKVASWMKPDALAFVHVFAHKTLTYHFEVADTTDWMSKYFFTGGIMPSVELFRHFNEDLEVTDQWWVNGQHYEKTANHWLENLDAVKSQAMPVLTDCYGKDASLWLQRWRMFYMAVAELFGYEGGEQWGVSHYLFKKAGK